MRTISIIMMGFGNVGQAMAHLLRKKKTVLASKYDLSIQVTGIATASHGTAIDPGGIDLQKAAALKSAGQSLAVLSRQPAPPAGTSFIRACPGDILLETSPVNTETGQPAIEHLQTALECNMHAITANKGPIVHAFESLSQLARNKQRRFMYESTVMDGAPIFSLVRETLPAAQISGFMGILNSCTNLLIERMENGESLEEAIEYAQSIGITETNPLNDIEGWDAAIKVAALSTVVLGHPLTPQQVNRQGIEDITPVMIEQALQAGERWKLVCRAEMKGSDTKSFKASVAPERVMPNSPLFSVKGTSSYIQFFSDVLPGLGILESNPSPETTAYGLLADLINAVGANRQGG
jgi:homoserine dehydrogenase